MNPRTPSQAVRVLLKWLGIIPLLAAYLFISNIIFIIPLPQKTKRSAAIRTLSFFSRRMLSLLRIHVSVKHPEHLRRNSKACLVVANHLSYIDIFIISSLLPSLFITSVELRNTRLLGMLARAAGCLFVERRKAAGLKKEIAMISRVLGQGVPVTLFPEGTTSNGDRVRQFKISLFDAAIITRRDILPVCLRYTGLDGQPLTGGNRDSVFYYGGIPFLKHLSKILTLKSIDVEVVLLKAIRSHPHHTRKDLAAETYQAISSAYSG